MGGGLVGTERGGEGGREGRGESGTCIFGGY